MDRRLALIVLAALALVAGFAVNGCDPKLTGTEDGSGNGGPGDLPDPVVTDEALIVGQIATLHAELMANALALAAEFDTASAVAPNPRAIFTAQCITSAETDPDLPEWSMVMNSCVDGHGTTVNGGGYLEPLTSVDGYAFFPYTVTDMIIAINATDDRFNHTVNNVTSPGAFEFKFARTTGQVTSVSVDHFIKHLWRSEEITFSYADETSYTGSVGSFGAFPDAGSVCRVVWDGVGIFEINYLASGQAVYTMQAVQFQVDLSNGNVIVVQN
jgi:hypothetical protein